MLYLVHLDRPIGRSRHYLGYCDSSFYGPEAALRSRVERHRHGAGSKLLAAANQAGVGWRVVWTGAGGRREELRVKRLHGTLEAMCPVCTPKVQA